ncbi:MAG TPA: hypothetical protein VIG38_14195 [Hyphomicrobium sp.]
MALLLSLVSLGLGGCSTAASSPTGGLFGGLMANISEPEPKPTPSLGEMEGDGLEGQRPPPLRMYRRDDDPTQPFSPNYGSVPMPAADDGEPAVNDDGQPAPA